MSCAFEQQTRKMPSMRETRMSVLLTQVLFTALFNLSHCQTTIVDDFADAVVRPHKLSLAEVVGVERRGPFYGEAAP